MTCEEGQKDVKGGPQLCRHLQPPWEANQHFQQHYKIMSYLGEMARADSIIKT